VAHWNEQRDERWLEMMNASPTAQTPEGKQTIEDFHKTGDIIYWQRFVTLIRQKLSPA
jgi:hypothetical protein